MKPFERGDRRLSRIFSRIQRIQIGSSEELTIEELKKHVRNLTRDFSLAIEEGTIAPSRGKQALNALSNITDEFKRTEKDVQELEKAKEEEPFTPELATHYHRVLLDLYLKTKIAERSHLRKRIDEQTWLKELFQEQVKEFAAEAKVDERVIAPIKRREDREIALEQEINDLMKRLELNGNEVNDLLKQLGLV